MKHPDKNSCLSPEQIEQLTEILAPLGDVGDRVFRLTLDAARILVSQLVILEDSVWREKGDRDSTYFEAFRSAFGSQDSWDDFKFIGVPLLDYAKAINTKTHCLSRSRGASKYFKSVTERQKGEFCAMCGAREGLEVDHIIPVSQGGDADSIANMQLLCRDCNNGKSSFNLELVAAAWQLTTSKQVSIARRYKILDLNSVNEQGFNVGQCNCGESARNRQLTVRRIQRELAANFLNLQIVCDQCEEK